MPRHFLLPALLMSAVLLAACGDDPTSPGPGNPVPVAQVVLESPPALLAPGQSVRLTAVARSASGQVLSGRTITWSSSQTAVASVTSDGRLTATAPGTTIVTATSEGRKAEATVRVAVDDAVASVQLRWPPELLLVGGTTRLMAMAFNARGEELPDAPITWTSSNTDAATVTTDGLLTAVAAGATIITASSEGKSAQFELRVSATPLTVAKVVIVQGEATPLRIGASVALRAEARTADDQVVGGLPVTWHSDDMFVAAVDANGVVTAVATGIAQVTARIAGFDDRITVNVEPNVQRIVIDPTSLVLVAGETVQLHATAYGDGNMALDVAFAWRSTDAAVATVTGPGRVTALRPGWTTIRATAEGVTGEVQALVVGASDFDLVRVNGAALPARMFSVVEPDGSTTRYDAHQGTLRLTGQQRYEQVFSFWVFPENAVGSQGTYTMTGDVTRDPATGTFHFHPDNQGLPAFTGVKTSDTTLEVTQQFYANATEAKATYVIR